MRESAARALAQCLEAVQEGQQAPLECLANYPEHSDELGPLIGTAELLSAAPEVLLRPGFRMMARRRLLAQLPERRHVTLWDQALARWRFGSGALYVRTVTMALMGLVILAGFLLGGSRVVSASGDALPGDALYPVKVAVEESRLVLSGEERAFGLYLEFAQVRVDELERLSAVQRFENVPAATGRFERQIQKAEEVVAVVGGQDAARSRVLAEQLDASLSEHRTRLERLLETAPASVRPALEHAIRDVEDEPEQEDEDRSGDDADGEQGHEPGDFESDEAGSDPEELESVDEPSMNDNTGGDTDDDSSGSQELLGRRGGTEEDVGEGGVPDGDSNSGEREGENVDQGDDRNVDPDAERGDAETDASDEGSDSGEMDGEDGIDNADSPSGEAEGETGHPSGSNEGSSDRSDDDPEPEPEDGSGSDDEPSDSSSGNSSHSQDDDSEQGTRQEPDSDEDSSSGVSSGPDREQHGDSDDDSDHGDGKD
jgi:hypothetical protein